MQNLNVLPQPYQRMMENHFTRLADELSGERGTYNTKAEWLQRREEVRAGLIHALGGFPEERCPLNAGITGRIERDGYVIEKLLYQSRPGFYVTAAVYAPKNARLPTPVISILKSPRCTATVCPPSVVSASEVQADGNIMIVHNARVISIIFKSFILFTITFPRITVVMN